MLPDFLFEDSYSNAVGVIAGCNMSKGVQTVVVARCCGTGDLDVASPSFLMTAKLMGQCFYVLEVAIWKRFSHMERSLEDIL